MNINTAPEIIRSLKPKQICGNNKGDFVEIRNDYLCLGAKMTEKSVVPNKSLFKGWFRFFNSEYLGEKTPICGGFQQSVVSDDQARLWVLVRAVEEIWNESMDELAHSVGALPINLYILSARPSFISALTETLAEAENSIQFPLVQLDPKVIWYLRLMHSVYVCSVNEDVIREIRHWPVPLGTWTTR